VAEKFENELAGVYANPEALVDDTIASFGWTKDLDRLLEGDPLLRAVVTFDRAAIRALAQDHYQIVSVEGALYVFQPLPVGGNPPQPASRAPPGARPRQNATACARLASVDENRAVAPRWPRKGQETATGGLGRGAEGPCSDWTSKAKRASIQGDPISGPNIKAQISEHDNQKENIMNEQQGQLAGESRTNEQHLKTPRYPGRRKPARALRFLAQLNGSSITEEIRGAIEERLTAAQDDPEVIARAQGAQADIEREAAARSAAIARFIGKPAIAGSTDRTLRTRKPASK
jgi:hypothetical protein